MTGAQHFKSINRVRVKDKLVEPFVPHYQVRHIFTFPPLLNLVGD